MGFLLFNNVNNCFYSSQLFFVASPVFDMVINQIISDYH